MKTSKILTVGKSSDYELVDSGDGEKLERVGRVLLSRPDPQALWSRRLPESEWKKADGRFEREDDRSSKSGWTMKKEDLGRWQIKHGNLDFVIKPTAFKHIGIFPEQLVNWQWLEERISEEKSDDFSVLNLFGYTGGATLACARAGAKVVHIDGSKTAMSWARENAEISGLSDKPVRWILEDARTFVSREIKRGNKYDGIIMDPPAFGHGPDNELWKIEDHFLPLVSDCMNILKDKPVFFLINGYSAGYSAVAYENILLPLLNKYGGSLEIGELAIEETAIENLPSRILPCGIFARWKK